MTVRQILRRCWVYLVAVLAAYAGGLMIIFADAEPLWLLAPSSVGIVATLLAIRSADHLRREMDEPR